MPGRGRGRGGFRTDNSPRSVLVSKALSRLLRHAAVQEHIPIDNHGYVRMDHLLGWQRLRNMKPPVTFEEVIEVVKGNDKKRFAMKYGSPAADAKDDDAGDQGGEAATTPTIEADTGIPEPNSETQTETETQRAISILESLRGDEVDTRRFFIRATQGHSMRAVEAENLLSPISLDDPTTIPDTVVHGTFYGAWEKILHSGGLKSMTRNHVHFATGPSLSEVLPASSHADDGKDGAGIGSSHDAQGKATPKGKDKSRNNLGLLLGKNKVISGMRSDAQILIYIDIRKALAEDKAMKWWRSENGVILSEGVVAHAAPPSPPQPETQERSGEKTAETEAEEEKGKGKEKLVPIAYFLAAVEVKEGIGLLWEAGKGTVRELPEQLRTRAVPRGKGERPQGKRQR
ncbi:uncharacterized protein A1O5_05069 [Cladophialophora psammophila CBS 110553]|uniref:2'-phosphotransferase n=1 Tax=Cladophialophora psammophila CBS 110553 TaxID=1182543 RepID=W9WTJ2_9EURO|nr:uncharacterized protein A1O5_05069 [Cladophialophora psammophila CBS 110553]EXJ71263.1 hypothetical protein A1O5_05069 [Cladophialophora psammophila CBS 110553]